MSLIGWLTAFVSDTTIALVEEGTLLGTRQLDMGNSGLSTRTINFKLPLSRDTRQSNRKTYRNPVLLAKELHAALNLSSGRRPCDLADDLGLSRARVTQLLRVLKLSPSVLQTLEELGDRWPTRIVGEHSLRSLNDLPETRQMAALRALLKARSPKQPA